MQQSKGDKSNPGRNPSSRGVEDPRLRDPETLGPIYKCRRNGTASGMSLPRPGPIKSDLRRGGEPQPKQTVVYGGVRYDMVWYGTWYGIIKRNS